MKGIIAAGGKGTRLHPLTAAVNKHLLPVHDKPMIYYPLTTLVRAGIREIMIVSSPDDLPAFKKCLGDGSQFGIRIVYAEQAAAKGIADILRVDAVQTFIGNDAVCLVLGDNVFWGAGLGDTLRDALRDFARIDPSIPHALIFGVASERKEQLGVMVLSDDGSKVEKLVEKPSSRELRGWRPSKTWAIPGLYIYTHQVRQLVHDLQPSARGEYEITDLNRVFSENHILMPRLLPPSVSWADTGTHRDIREAGFQVAAEQEDEQVIIGSPELAALKRGFLTRKQFDDLLALYPASEYRELLARVAGARNAGEKTASEAALRQG